MTAKKKDKIPTFCPECETDDDFHFDPFGFGSLMDEHMDTVASEEDIAKRIANAMEMASKLGGLLSAGMESELEQLTKPKLSYKDFIRGIKQKKRQEASKNNWNVPKRKQLFSGLYIPKKEEYVVKFLLAYDCSGSMTKEQISHGISQTASLDERGFGNCVPWDSVPFWKDMVKIKSASSENLKLLKYKGGGGTVLMPVFNEYQEKVGDVDIIIVISDFCLADQEAVEKYIPPKNTHIVWLNVNSNQKFKPISGRLFNLDIAENG